MAVQVSYPGVYIEEFAPGAPIQGVGTSTAAFIGTATSGPIEKPTLIQSWDAFEETFGGFIAEQPSSYLAPAVYGFLLNGGTSCYVLRAGSGSMATANLDSRQSGGNPEPVLVVRALQEGVGGNAISVQVVESSRLRSALTRGSSLDTALTLHRAETNISAMAPDRTQLTVSDNSGFAQDDRILLASGTDTATVVVNSTQGSDTLVLAAPIPGTADFSGGTVRTADLVPPQRVLRLSVPAPLELSQVLQQGATISIALGSITEVNTVQAVSDDTITLTNNLTNSYSLANATNLPSIALETNLALHRAETNIVTMDSSSRAQLTVSDNSGFAQGDLILLASGTDTATVVVNSTQGSDTLVLAAPIPGTADFSGGTVRTADLEPGRLVLRLAVPAGLRLNQVLPRGTTVSITLGSVTEIRTVESSGGDTVTLTEGLTNTYSLADASNLPRVNSLEFNLVIIDASNGTGETFEQLATHPQHPNYWRNIVVSGLVSLEEPATPPAPMPDDPRPAVGTYDLEDGTADDRAAARAQIIADPNRYLDLLKPYDEVALVCIPGFTDAAVQQAMIAHCEAMFDRFAILDSIRGATPGNGIREQFEDVRSEFGFAALYYPWILARNPLTGKDELWPPSGHIAGIYARTDEQRGVHKAPANTNIRGALGLERQLTNEEQGPLNLMGIDVLRVFPGQAQPIVWGARTTATDRNWQYVNIRRLFLFLEESIEEGIRWAVFEPNNLQLWQKLKRTITEFLTRVWRDGALFGATAEEAFYVRIDEALNPPSTRALGRLYIEIGVVPTYPAEFIIVRIGIWQGGSEVSEG